LNTCSGEPRRRRGWGGGTPQISNPQPCTLNRETSTLLLILGFLKDREAGDNRIRALEAPLPNPHQAHEESRQTGRGGYRGGSSCVGAGVGAEERFPAPSLLVSSRTSSCPLVPPVAQLVLGNPQTPPPGARGITPDCWRGAARFCHVTTFETCCLERRIDVGKSKGQLTLGNRKGN
jgi:hypothetical protein